jgi:NitT/TauT family transport system ATP-binding protein
MDQTQQPNEAHDTVGFTQVQPAPAPERESVEAAEPHIVDLVNVSKWFDDARTGEHCEALQNFNLTIERGEEGAFVVLLGPSGCGKSTILTLISGLAQPDAGEVRVFGETVTGPNPMSATVPQAYTCFPWRTVIENVEFGLCIRGMSKRERREIAMDYLERVGLKDRSNAYPKQLSGGMQQRVAIARTLAMKLPIVLMDEPFGALDAQTRSDMQQMLLKLWEAEKNTIIFVTHDITEAVLLGDRIIVFSARPANILWDQGHLDKRVGHERIAQEDRFVALCEELRQELKGQGHDHREEPPPPVLR